VYGPSGLHATMADQKHVLVIGPGLGRDKHMQDCARVAFELAKGMDMGVVVDADGLWLVQVCPCWNSDGLGWYTVAPAGCTGTLCEASSGGIWRYRANMLKERTIRHSRLARYTARHPHSQRHGVQAVMRKDGMSSPPATAYQRRLSACAWFRRARA
jgi:hypothetical protein